MKDFQRQDRRSLRRATQVINYVHIETDNTKKDEEKTRDQIKASRIQLRVEPEDTHPDSTQTQMTAFQASLNFFRELEEKNRKEIKHTKEQGEDKKVSKANENKVSKNVLLAPENQSIVSSDNLIGSLVNSTGTRSRNGSVDSMINNNGIRSSDSLVSTNGIRSCNSSVDSMIDNNGTRSSDSLVSTNGIRSSNSSVDSMIDNNGTRSSRNSVDSMMDNNGIRSSRNSVDSMMDNNGIRSSNSLVSTNGIRSNNNLPDSVVDNNKIRSKNNSIGSLVSNNKSSSNFKKDHIYRIKIRASIPNRESFDEANRVLDLDETHSNTQLFNNNQSNDAQIEEGTNASIVEDEDLNREEEEKIDAINKLPIIPERLYDFKTLRSLFEP